MRRILILLGFVLGVLSAHAESKSYTINDMFTISVDSKLELRDKKGLYEQKTKNNNLPVTSDEVINRLAYQELAPQMHMTIKPSTKGFFFDNENNFFKSCFLCIIQREIHNDMAFRIDRIDLF